MMKPEREVISLLQGRHLATAESCTGGGIGAALTSVSGASRVYLGGVISYDSRIKAEVLGVSREILETLGAVSAPVAEMMASNVRRLMDADVSVSVTGLAGPGGDEFGHPVGTVFVGYSDENGTISREYHFSGDREAVRRQTVAAALELILEQNRQREVRL